MFECSACTLRAIRSLFHNAPSLRCYSKPTRIGGFNHRRQPNLSRTYSDAIASRAPGTPYLNAAQLRHQNKSSELPGEATAIDTTQRERRHLRKELVYLTDPLKLSEYIQQLLRKGQTDKAIELCRLASKSMNCVVSWNRLIDWHMGVGDVQIAVRLFNDMKKRAQFPDSYTYLLLLRGLANDSRHVSDPKGNSGRAARAIAIYNSMKSPTSRVKPSIIHTNVTLRACSRYSDMNGLWSIIGQIPEHGPNSADRITFTTILQAIKHGAADARLENLAFHEKVARKREAVADGRKIWSQIVPKWQAGAISIDAELVHAMARLLMQSPDLKDWDDVLTLIQQTTNIPRAISPLGSPGREVAHLSLQTITQSLPVQSRDAEAVSQSETGQPSSKHASVANPSISTTSSHELRPPKYAPNIAFAKPDNAILSVVLDACSMMRIHKIALTYWDIFTNGYDVRPDLTNIHALLRQLAFNRASGKAIYVLQNAVSSRQDLRTNDKTFLLALSCCIRDKKNPRALEHGIRILDIMCQAKGQLSVPVLGTYLDLLVQAEDKTRLIEAGQRLFEELPDLTRIASLDGGQPLLRSISSALHSQLTINSLPEHIRLAWESKRSSIDQMLASKKPWQGLGGSREVRAKRTTPKALLPSKTFHQAGSIAQSRSARHAMN